MSLNFDYTKCALINGEKVQDHPNDEDRWHPVGEALVWTMMVIGMREINAGNIGKVWERISLYQKVTGPMLQYGDGTKAYVVREDLVQHIGLSTNVATISDAAWAKHIAKVATNYHVKNADGVSARSIVALQCAKYQTKKEEEVTA